MSVDSIINDLRAQIESLELRLDAQDALINDLYERLDSRITTETENLRQLIPQRKVPRKNKVEQEDEEPDTYPKHRKWAMIDL